MHNPTTAIRARSDDSDELSPKSSESSDLARIQLPSQINKCVRGTHVLIRQQQWCNGERGTHVAPMYVAPMPMMCEYKCGNHGASPENSSIMTT